MPRFDLLVTGTGRCGTMFFSRFLSSVGVHCTHEFMCPVQGWDKAAERMADARFEYVRAESSWLMAPWLDKPELAGTPVVHLLRHPRTYIESLCKIWRCEGHTPWTQFAADTADLDEWFEDRPTWCAAKWARWNRLIERQTEGRPVLRYRIEYHPWVLLYQLAKRGLVGTVDLTRVYDNRLCNTKTQDKRYHAQLSDIAPEVRGPMLELAAEYGYSWSS